jgi:hypothetical protein
VGMPMFDPIEHQFELFQVMHDGLVAPVHPPNRLIFDLARNLVRVLPAMNLTSSERQQLAINISMILNSANLPPEGVTRVLASARNILTGPAQEPRPGGYLLLSNLQGIAAHVTPQVGGLADLAAALPTSPEPPQPPPRP